MTGRYRKGQAVRISEWILGIVFLLSGSGKMLNAAGFGELISSYGLDWFSVLSPVIILIELFLGLLLLLRLWPRFSAFACLLLLMVFTGAFLYGHLIHGIEDCGCFGSLGSGMPAWVTYLRNIVLMALACYVMLCEKRGEHTSLDKNWMSLLLLAALMTVATFWTGQTWHPSTYYMNNYAKPHPLLGCEINQSPIGRYLQVSADSTYLVWVFSYSCGGCINSMENIKHYQDVADRFVPLAVTADPDGRKRQLLQFPYDPVYVGNELSGFIEVLPTLLYVVDGKVKFVIEETVPSIYMFKSNYLEMSNDEILQQILTPKKEE
jgi:uncharacterized membrane protein YphA (DoxX/SURF4 family)